MHYWLVAMACGLAQALQAMANGAAARAGVGAVWVGAMSATVSALSLLALGLVVLRLPLPATDLLASEGWKTVIGGLMGAVIVSGVAFATPRLGPTQTFLLYFVTIAVASAAIDNFGLFGAAVRPLAARQFIGIALAGAGLALARA